MRVRFRGALLAALFVAAGPSGLRAQASAGLDAGIRAYTEHGDARTAIQQIGAALDAGAVPTSQRPRAHVFIAHAFLALGDTLSAMPHIERAIEAAPCVLPAEADAPPAWRDLYERARPRDVSCTPKFATATLMSMVVPGLGQRALGQSGRSLYFLGGTLAAGSAGLFFLHRGDQRYTEYQSSTTFPELLTLYDQARSARRTGLTLGGAAAALYLWNVLDTAVMGLAHDRGLSAVRPLSVAPIVTPGSRGLAFRLEFP